MNLEDRTVPATLTWTGAVDANWSTVGNWSGGTGTEIPDSPDDILIFGSGAANLSSVNDISNFQVDAIQITEGGYTFSGNAVDLVTGLTDTAATGTNTISLSIAGTGGLSKTGTGELLLNAANSYTGTTVTSDGNLVVANANALGATSSGTTLQTGNARLELRGGVTLAAEAIDYTSTGTIIGTGGTNEITGAITLPAANARLQAETGSTLIVSGVISGSASQNLLVGTSGVTGTVVLSGANTFNNFLSIQGGTLVAASSQALGGSTNFTQVLSNSTLAFQGGITTAEPLLMSGNGVGGNGALLNLSGDNTHTGTINQTGNSRVGSDAGTLTLSGNISGSTSFTKVGAGTVILAGANTYSGGTNVNAGTLTVSGSQAIVDTSSVTVASGATLALNANETIGLLFGAGDVTLGANFLSINSNSIGTTFSGNISGTGGLIKNNTVGLTLDGNNTYTGATIINAGTLILSGSQAIADTSAVTVASGASIVILADEAIGSLAGAGDVNVTSTTLTVGNDNTNTTYTGEMSGTGSLIKNGSGVFSMSGVNSRSGNTTVNGGTLTASGGQAIGNTSAVAVGSGATLTLTDNELIGSLAGSGTVNLGTATLSTGANNTSTTFSGDINGTGGLTKFGTGTFTLTGNSTFTGLTNINGGTVVLDGSVGGNVSVINNTTLSGLGTINGSAVVEADGILAPGNSPGGLTFNAGLTLEAGSIFTVELNGTTPVTDYDQIFVDGTVDLTDSILTLNVGFTPAAGDSFTIINNSSHDAVTGTFNGLAEGALVTAGGATFRISYVGGDGNDVTLTVLAAITGVTGPTNGTYGVGENLDFTVTFGAPVTVTGTPQVGLTVGAATVFGTFQSGSGTTNLLFRYIVQSGDLDTDGIAVLSPINLNGGTIQDMTGGDAVLSFTPPNTAGVLVDAIPPIVTNPSFEDTPDLTGWTVTAGTGTGSVPVIRTGGAATDGSAYARLTLDNQGGTAGRVEFGPTLRSSNFTLTAGQTVGLDFQPFETADDTFVRIFLYAADGTRVATLMDGTFNGQPGWLTTAAAAPATGDYYLEAQVGSFDESFGTVLGAQLFLDNVRAGVTPPLIADIVDITPNPTTTPVTTVTVKFNQAIDPTTFTIDDLFLSLGSNLSTNLINSSVTITAIDALTYEIGGLTGTTGTYRFIIDTSGINTVGGMAGLGNGWESWTVTTAPTVPPVVPPTVPPAVPPTVPPVVPPTVPPVPVPPAPVPPVVISTGSGTGGNVQLYDLATGTAGTNVQAYPGYTGEVRLASGDVNGDGVADTITSVGAGPTGGHVKVFDGATGEERLSFYAFPEFSGGVFVAAGDVNGDGFDDIITAAGIGGSPHVKVFSGKDGSELVSFFAYDTAFTGGVFVAAGDVDGDGFDDIITGAGAGGAPHVKVFSGKDQSILQSFFAYGNDFNGGVYVSAADFNGDGQADIVTGAGAGGAPHVKVFSGKDSSELSNFLAYDPAFLGGVRVGTGVVNNANAILVGAGPGGSPHVKAFDLNGNVLQSFFAGMENFPGGMYVG